MAGYLFLLSLFVTGDPVVWKSKGMNVARRVGVFVLLVCQLLMYVVVAFAPAIFSIGMHAALIMTAGSSQVGLCCI